MECIFCKIINKEVPATIVAETDDVIVIKDISPKAPVHNLIIPKKHVDDITDLQQQDMLLAGKLVMMAQQLSKELERPAFRLIVNNGAAAGQCVFHLHLHFLAGKEKLPGF